MLHARSGRSLRCRALPIALLGLSTAAFGGLVVVAPPGEVGQDVVAYADATPVEVPVLAPVERERGQARASRGRRIAEAQAAAEQAAAEAAARAAAEAAAAQAAAEAAAAAKAQAEAEAAAAAKAKAAAEAAAKKKASLQAPAAAARRGGACPVPNASFTDTWGAPRSGGRSHQGTDLMAPHGSPVYAVASGRVRTASSSAGGISLYLDAENGETYFYAHNQSNAVGTGQRVQAGDLIARVGSSGNAPSSAPHVHFERQVGGRSVNPYSFLRGIC